VSGIVVVRTSDSRVHGIDISNGNTVWLVQQSSPALTLRGVGIPLIRDGIAYVGMDNGKVLAISIVAGNIVWESRVDVPSGRTELERIVDVDGKLAADDTFIYAASYHGRMAAMDRVNGRPSWARDISSAAGMTSDTNNIYLVDRDDSVWALDKSSGITIWKQDALLYRELSSPILIQGTLLVGDDEGYIHALSKDDGKIIGRTRVGDYPVQAVQLESSEHSYFVDASGKLSTFTLTPAN
jgi:outer membrane protein assembly factor BamB